MTLKEQIRNSLLNFVCGDAFGLPYEGCMKGVPFENWSGYGTYNQPPGTYSDDAALLLSSISSTFSLDLTIKGNDRILISKAKTSLKMGFLTGLYSVDNILFDIGMATKRAIDNDFKVEGIQYGNGGLVRIIPYMLLFSFGKLPGFIMNDLLSLTHTADEFYLKSLGFYTRLFKLSIYDGERLIKLKELSEEWQKLKEDKKFNELSNTDGTVMNAVDICINGCLLNKTFEDIIRLGGDTDTNAALYGFVKFDKSLPFDYKKELRNVEFVEKTIDLFIDKLFSR